jgi:hypothetical protein
MPAAANAGRQALPRASRRGEIVDWFEKPVGRRRARAAITAGMEVAGVRARWRDGAENLLIRRY